MGNQSALNTRQFLVSLANDANRLLCWVAQGFIDFFFLTRTNITLGKHSHPLECHRPSAAEIIFGLVFLVLSAMAVSSELRIRVTLTQEQPLPVLFLFSLFGRNIGIVFSHTANTASLLWISTSTCKPRPLLVPASTAHYGFVIES